MTHNKIELSKRIVHENYLNDYNFWAVSVNFGQGDF
jgi:hypothetical protein